MIAFKLLRKLKNGELKPLFINRKQNITPGVWLQAEEHRTKGYQFRPGWHCLLRPEARHLSEKGRAWCMVEIKDVVIHRRPEAQGGKWALAQQMKLIREI